MGSFSWAQIIWSLLLSLALSLLVAEFYKRYGKTASTPANLGPTLVILCLTITFIMEVVGNSVARAFSLAGALSIVRFRNAIKETEDIAVIFLIMAIGLACGSGFFIIAGVSTLFILIVWFGLKHFQQVSRERGFDLLHLEADSGLSVDEAFKKIRMTAFCTDVALIQTRIDPRSGKAVFIYRVLFKNNVAPESDILKPLLGFSGIHNATLTHQGF